MTNPISNEAVQAALQEISTQTPEQIEQSTAIKWGARALAAWMMAQATLVKQGNGPQYLFWYKEAAMMKHEAVEHAGWGPAGLVDALKAQLQGVP
jgi:hypothetical protein